MDMMRKRMMARTALSLGSAGLMAGAVIAYFGGFTVGDAIMIVGGVSLVLGVMLLASVPADEENGDAG